MLTLAGTPLCLESQTAKDNSDEDLYNSQAYTAGSSTPKFVNSRSLRKPVDLRRAPAQDLDSNTVSRVG